MKRAKRTAVFGEDTENAAQVAGSIAGLGCGDWVRGLRYLSLGQFLTQLKTYRVWGKMQSTLLTAHDSG
uniref:Uncharacterized protein n=1 Tax=Desertifilum tharense IPPAS B-1220 TaxID=1781255 RepID=A0ACD5GYC2_9CYAN